MKLTQFFPLLLGAVVTLNAATLSSKLRTDGTDNATFAVVVANTGGMAGDEDVEAHLWNYARDNSPWVRKGRRVNLNR